MCSSDCSNGSGKRVWVSMGECHGGIWLRDGLRSFGHAIGGLGLRDVWRLWVGGV